MAYGTVPTGIGLPAGYAVPAPYPRHFLTSATRRPTLGRRVAARVPGHARQFVSLTFDAFTKGLVDRFRSALPSRTTHAPGGGAPGKRDGRTWIAGARRDCPDRTGAPAGHLQQSPPAGRQHLPASGANIRVQRVFGTNTCQRACECGQPTIRGPAHLRRPSRASQVTQAAASAVLAGHDPSLGKTPGP